MMEPGDSSGKRSPAPFPFPLSFPNAPGRDGRLRSRALPCVPRHYTAVRYGSAPRTSPPPNGTIGTACRRSPSGWSPPFRTASPGPRKSGKPHPRWRRYAICGPRWAGKTGKQRRRVAGAAHPHGQAASNRHGQLAGPRGRENRLSGLERGPHRASGPLAAA